MYSFIIPVFNRPFEVEELLESLTHQQLKDFEVIIVEDGSIYCSKEICESYKEKLDIHYYYKENSGPGESRNYGVERAKGDYVIILDSDVVLPEGYLIAVEQELKRQPADAFGGPDAAHPSFTPIQKAISYSMTAFFTTGGIRGGKKKMDKFYPRSFNMGIKKSIYYQLGGFSKMRFGEDIDFSIRIFKANLTCRLFPEAWVWHKRRTDFHKFFRQVYNSGIARINLYKKYPESLKLVHLLPMIFTMGILFLLFIILIGSLLLLVSDNTNIQDLGLVLIFFSFIPIFLYEIAIFTDATWQFKSPKIGVLSVIAAFTQLLGYGLGFIEAWWKRCVKEKNEFSAFDKTFYK